jgi:hypothetical protein
MFIITKFFSSFKSLNLKDSFYLGVNIPKPHPFVNESLHCDISQIITDIAALLPQFSDFISQFNNVLSESGINVITDSSGNMSIEVPKDMADSAAKKVSTRIGIIDRLIFVRGQEIDSLFEEARSAENKLKLENPNYISEITQKYEEYKRLKASYKH